MPTYEYRCNDCGKTFSEDITERITDNCALDIEIICRECGEVGVLYFTRCTEEYRAKELVARMARMKENRRN